MELILIPLTAFLASILTFFSGFGLGTILTPVFLLFFPLEVAIGLTAIVHFCNNLFKLSLVRKNVNKEVVLKFGIPAVIAAFLGSLLLVQLSDVQPIYSYHIAVKKMDVYFVKLLISILLIMFSIMDFIPFFKKLEFNQDKLAIGGILSGFFGGLSGVQGALRSAFLIKVGLSKESFVATTVVISCFVDFVRISVYSTNFNKIDFESNWKLILISILAAIIGAVIGNRLLKKITLKSLQTTVAIMLIIIAVCLGMGLI